MGRRWHAAAPCRAADRFGSLAGARAYRRPVADMERSRLQELRLEAIEEWAEIMLALHRQAEVVASLGDAVAKDPLREKLRWLLMSALFHCGR